MKKKNADYVPKYNKKILIHFLFRFSFLVAREMDTGQHCVVYFIKIDDKVIMYRQKEKTEEEEDKKDRYCNICIFLLFFGLIILLYFIL